MKNLTDGLMAGTGDTGPDLHTGGSFEQGLRSGMTAAGGSLRALTGGVGEAMGFRDFAAAQYAKAKAAQDLAAAQAPEVSSYKQVLEAPDLSTGLRRAGSYVSGLAGQSLPQMGAGLAAGGLTALTGGGALPVFAAATAASAPFHMGEAIQNQQNDPASLQAGPGERLAIAGGAGMINSALDNIVPLATGAKMLGRGMRMADRAEVAAANAASKAAGKGVLRTVGINALEGSLMEGGTEAGQEFVQQQAHSLTNPNRDTSKDLEQIIEAGVGGAALGGVMGGAGGVGEVAHRPGAMTDLKDRTTALMEQAASKVAETAAPAAEKARAKLGDFFGPKNVDQDTAAAQALADGVDVPATQAKDTAGLKAAHEALAARTADWATKLMEDPAVAQKHKDAVAALGGKYDSLDAMRTVAQARVADTAARTGTKVVDALSEHASDLYGKIKPEAAKSEINPGIRAAISETVMPFLEKHNPALLENPDAINKLADSLRNVMAVSAAGKLDDTTVGHLQNVFGPQTSRVMKAVADAVTPGDAKVLAAINKIGEAEAVGADRARFLEKALGPEVMQKHQLTRNDLDGLSKVIEAHVDESAYKNMGAEERAIERRNFESDLREHVGNEAADAVLTAYAKRAEDKIKASKIDDQAQVEATAALADPESGMSEKTVEDAADKPLYFGKGDRKAPQLIDAPEVHREKFNNEAPAERLLAQAEKANPDRITRFVPYDELPAEMQDQLRATHSGAEPFDPKGKGLVVSEGSRQETRLNPDEFQKMRAGTGAELNSKSRIDTPVGAVDAYKIVREMYAKMPESDTDKTQMHRLARAFAEGMAAISDYAGHRINVLDSVVVARRGGEEITAGDLKKLSFAPEHNIDGRGSADMPISHHKSVLNRAQLAMDRIEAETADLKAKSKAGEALSPKEEAFLSKKREEWMWERRRERAAEEALAAHDRAARLEADAVATGKSDVAGDEEIHTAVDKLGEDKVARKTDASGQSLKYDSASTKARNDPVETYNRFLDKIEKMESASGAAKTLAAKARALDAITDKMKPVDVTNLIGRVIMAKKPSDMADAINVLTSRYARELEAAKANPKPDEPSIWRDRAKKGDAAAAYNLQRAAGTKEVDLDTQRSVADHIEKVLGPKVKVVFERMLHGGEYTADDVVKISLLSLDPMGTAFHESLHGLMVQMRKNDLHGVNQVLFKAASTAHVMKQLRELLHTEPEALRQIETDVEERAAYMYQFAQTRGADGKPLLRLGDAPQNVISRIADAIRKVLGIWTNDARAVHIMDYFQSGELAKISGDRGAVSRALLEQGTNKTFEAIKAQLKPLARLAENVIGAGDAVLRDMNNPAITKIADKILSRTTDSQEDPGFITVQGAKYRQVMNAMVDQFGNVDMRHINDALASLQSGKPADSAEARIVAKVVRKTLDHMYQYMQQAGVKVRDLGFKEDYFPVVWDPDYISKNTQAFRDMLEPYIRSGEFKGSADELISSLISRQGNEFGIETAMPGMQHLKERSLDFIKPEDRAPFLQKNLFATMHSYVQQATRRAEWARRFGDEGQGMAELLAEAKMKYGATDADIKTVQKYIRGVDGTLGDSIDPGMRRLFGNLIVYQNVRLLPLAIFSMAVDPGGILVRGGTLGEAFNAFKRGIKEIPRGFKDAPKDEWYKLAETMGVIDNHALIRALGSSYSQGMVGDTGRKINDLFFKYNLVEQMNTSMRVAAMPAALNFLAKHADGTHSVHSPRWLGELGLKPGEMIIKDGRPLVSYQEFLDHGLSKQEAAERAVKMRGVVNKWVDGAVLRPNAAQKPIWMNDPHFALIAHLKQFVYSFNETIIKRVLNEARHGNYTPAYGVAGYVPIMIASDLLKGAILTGGGVPDFKDDWDLWDYIGHGMQRAGLLGVGQFGMDMMQDVKHGGVGIGGVAGPTIEQLSKGVQVLGGKGQFDRFALDSLPANMLAKAAVRGIDAPDPVHIE